MARYAALAAPTAFFSATRAIADQPAGALPERLLRDAAEREARLKLGRVVLALHLSRLVPPAPQPHHRRVAERVLEDVAESQGGQVFVLRSGDMVLLVPHEAALRGTGLGQDKATGEPVQALLTRLLQAETTAAGELISVFRLADGQARIGALLGATARQVPAPIKPVPAGPDPRLGSTAMLPALQRILQHLSPADLLRQETVATLPPLNAGATGHAIVPAYRVLGLAGPLLEARLAAHGVRLDDPWLQHWLTDQLDFAVIARLRAACGTGSALDPVAPDRPTLLLRTSLAALDGAAFSEFATPYRGGAVGFGIELGLVDACADPDGFVRARKRLADASVLLALGGIDQRALRLIDPAALQPDLVMLDAPQNLAAVAPALLALIARHGPDRVVLRGADSEPAMRWGRAQGLRHFQGRHVAAMLAAARLIRCPAAARCTLRQCADRAATPTPAGRRDCGNPALLDRAMPAAPRRQAA